MTITDNLTQTRDQWRTVGAGAWLLYDFVLSTGLAYQGQPLPKRYRMRAAKACFYNSRQLVLGSKTLRYCEGFAMNEKLHFAFEHAWALDPQDRVIDPTLADFHDRRISVAGEYQYYGLTIERSLLRKEWRYSGILRSDLMFRETVLRQLAPDWAQSVLEPWLEKHALRKFDFSP